jgi:hypothetical protein
MADNSILPKASAPLVDQTGRPTRAFYTFFNALVSSLQGQINAISKLVKNLALVIAALGGDPDSGEGIPDIAGQIDAKADKSITITGLGSIQGGGDLSQDRFISLDGDVDTVPGVSFYGSPDGSTKGWAAFSDNFAPSMDADDNVTLDLAEVADAGGGTLQRTAFDVYGRKTGTSAATTTDLPEGSNLYFTDARAADAAPIQSIVQGSGVTVDTTDPANPVISATGGGGGTFPFFLSNESPSNISLSSSSELPFFLADGTASDIPLAA